MVVLLRCNDVVYDSRALKYVKYYRDNQIDYKIIGWVRQGKADEKLDTIYFNKQAGFNVGGFSAVKNRILWMWFLLKQLRKFQKKDLVVHACDLDSAFPAVVYKQLFNHKCKVIFDIFDWYSATLHKQNKAILTAFKFMERLCVKHSDHMIICEPERKEQIPYSYPKEKLSVLPNIPFFDDDSFLHVDEQYQFYNDKVTFAYVGSITVERYIDEVITLAEKGFINLNLAGYGDAGIEQRLKSLKDCPNIRYYGKVKYQDALNIMYNSDIVYAMYSTISPNNVYAAPNKYYETMFLGKAIFTNTGTIMEKKVIINKIGYVAAENYDAIRNVALSINMDEAKVFGNNAHKLWVDKYSSYTANYLNTTYKDLLK